jgi:hypothetical protein
LSACIKTTTANADRANEFAPTGGRRYAPLGD